MKKIFAMISLFMLLPTASAGFISSSINIDVDDPPAIPMDKSVTVNANITLSWGFGMIFPLPATIEVSAENVPSWLTVSISPDNFVITPSGFTGGEAGKNVEISFHAIRETTAFVGESITIRASTSGNFLLKSSEATHTIYAMEDFVDNGLTIEAPSGVNMYKGEETTLHFNVTNKCNAPVYLQIEEENVSGFTFSHENNFAIGSKERKDISIKIKAEEAMEEKVKLKFIYYPPGHDEKKNYQEIEIPITSKTRGGGGSLAIGLVVVVVLLIIFGLWKRKR